MFCNVKGKAVPQHTYGGAGREEYSSYLFTTSKLDGGEWSASRPGRGLPPGKRPAVPIVRGGWVGPRAGLDTEVRGKILSPLPGIEPRPPDRPVRSQTLYWLSYPCSRCFVNFPNKRSVILRYPNCKVIVPAQSNSWYSRKMTIETGGAQHLPDLVAQSSFLIDKWATRL
jgi:hypothetical protein